MKDVFLSYRRKDAETEAFLLYKDLTECGYSVFFDHKSLGGGNFRSAIEEQIRTVKSVVVFLSGTSFDERIQNENDVYRNEIAFALKYKKRIVGIMLESFSGFPEKLPDDIEAIRNINCLRLYIGYYEAMLNRLTNESFLLPPLEGVREATASDEAIRHTVPDELRQMAAMSDERRMQCTQLLLQIMNTFNDSPICMRFYRYIDRYVRNQGVSDTPDYDGDIPTDLVTYLSFFETMYIVIGSGTIDISVIDFSYRFRFFAGCNIPIMQASELLPLGYQYPNIMSLYNIWCDHIVARYDHTVKCENISDEIPLYENDLHKQYAAYSFARKTGRPMRIRFLNRNLVWLNLTMRIMDKRDFDASMILQENMLAGIEENESKNIFEALSDAEMTKALREGCCVGLYDGEKLVAQMNLIVNPDETEDLTMDLDSERFVDSAILDYTVVDQSVRGFGIQKTLLFVAECMSKNHNKSGICAVSSPFNTHSIKNLLSQGYRIVATQPKYHSLRHYFWKAI